jgi:hypothetical protein
MMDIPRIEPVRLLYGHVSPETAYLVEDYPYGRRLRCRIRYWIDTAATGAYRGWQRLLHQTTDPRRPGHPWNSPRGSTYALRTWMYLDNQDHVQHTGLSQYGLDPHRDAWFRLTGIYQQLGDEDRRIYDTLLATSRADSQPWQRWEDIVTFLAEHLATHGQTPPVDNGFIERDGRPFYVGADAYATAVAVAHARLHRRPEGEQQK